MPSTDPAARPTAASEATAPRPRVGITAVPRQVPTAYGHRDADTAERGLVEGVVRAGGVPLLLPVVAAELAAPQLAGLDAIVFSGGQDIDIAAFGGERHPASTWLDPARDRHEVALWRAARAAEIPILAICRGLQLSCLLEGGELIAHLDGHDAGDRHAEVRHPATVAPGLLRDAVGTDTLSVNTIHHQAVATPPPDWTVVARSEDDVIEALEADDGPWFLGVQWHPELMLDDPTAGQPVFDAVVAATRG